MVTNNAQRTTRAEAKWLKLFSVEAGVNVVGQRARFTQGKLSSRRTRSACLALNAGGTVSQSPQALMAWHGQSVVDDYCATFVAIDWEQTKERVRDGARRSYKCLRFNLFPRLQGHGAGTRVS